MKTLLTQIAFVSCVTFVFGFSVTQVHAQQRQLKILYTQQEVGVRYRIKPVNSGNGNGWQYLDITSVIAGSAAERAGLQPGDGIYRVHSNNRSEVVDNAARFNAAIAASRGAEQIQLQVLDRNTRSWTWVSLTMQGLGNPNEPAPGPGPEPDPAPGDLPPARPVLTGIWMSSGGGTVHFRGSNPIRGESNVPWVGRSDLQVTPNGDGTYNFLYQQRDGLRDSGHGQLTPRGANTIDGYLINGLGMRFDFVLTR